MAGGVFGSGGGAALASRLEVPVLATVPLSAGLREDGDAGSPAVLTHPDDPASAAITELATALAGRARGLAGRQLPFAPRGR
jgi:ATP-binding protein involved in chromosome partitioning